VWWLRSYQSPAQHPSLSAQELAHVSDSAAADFGATIPWVRLFGFPQTWGLVIGKFLSDAAWFFYLSWLPKYLYDVRGFDTKAVGYYAWIPYAFAGLGALSGGWFSSYLLSRGKSVNFSRKLVLGMSAALMPIIIFVPHTPIQLTIVLFSIAFFGQQSWSTLVMILPTDLFPRRVVASVAGLVGFGGAMGGVVFNLIAGRMLDAGTGYGPVFAAVSTFHVLAFILIMVTIPQVRSLSVQGAR
jgi:MFS transporter, ACS family, hexuronate transporter